MHEGQELQDQHENILGLCPVLLASPALRLWSVGPSFLHDSWELLFFFIVVLYPFLHRSPLPDRDALWVGSWE